MMIDGKKERKQEGKEKIEKEPFPPPKKNNKQTKKKHQ